MLFFRQLRVEKFEFFSDSSHNFKFNMRVSSNNYSFDPNSGDIKFIHFDLQYKNTKTYLLPMWLRRCEIIV